MEFVFDTTYSKAALAVMARALRKTVRRKRSRRTHIFGWIVVAFALLISLPLGGEFTLDAPTAVTWAAVLVMVLALLFEDKLNGYFAGRRMLAGADRAVCTFTEEGYCSVATIGRTEWHYENIRAIAECRGYFVFIFDQSHAQIYDQSSIRGGTAEEFAAFITEKTGLAIVKV